MRPLEDEESCGARERATAGEVNLCLARGKNKQMAMRGGGGGGGESSRMVVNEVERRGRSRDLLVAQLDLARRANVYEAASGRQAAPLLLFECGSFCSLRGAKPRHSARAQPTLGARGLKKS